MITFRLKNKKINFSNRCQNGDQTVIGNYVSDLTGSVTSVQLSGMTFLTLKRYFLIGFETWGNMQNVLNADRTFSSDNHFRRGYLS